MGVELAAGAAVAGIAGGIYSANKQADTMGQMGAASLAQEQRDREAALGYAVNPQQMQQLQESITLNNQDITRKQALLASADPSLIEAGHQALALMQGKSAASLKPLQDQRAQQRQQLEQTLSSQLGPDYATSSQGQAALNNFDQQTANTMTNAQQQTIQNYLGVAQNTEQLGSLNPNMQNQQNIANQYGSVANRQVAALTGTPVNPSQQFAGQYASNQMTGNMFNTLGSFGMAGLANGGFKGFGGGGETEMGAMTGGTAFSGGGPIGVGSRMTP